MNGILIINKPQGCTSHDIVYKIKKATNEKVGHTGTLDPMATGVLPLLIGKGTLCSKYLINHDKRYLVELKLGKKTETADAEGKVIEEKEVDKEILEKEKVLNILHGFIGKQEQIPPIYSALKVNGKKLYEYARKGQEVEIKPRNIEIYDIELKNIEIENNKITFEVSCSKGTYIRSLCEDIAEKMGNIGYMSSLKRLQVGEFKIDDSYDINELIIQDEKNKYKIKNEINIDNYIIEIEEIFKEKEIIKLNKKELELFLNGVKITKNNKEEIYRIYDENNKFIGIGILKCNLLKRDIII